MIPSSRGVTPLDQVAEKQGAQTAFRIRCEYLPGPAPFPESPEEAEWLSRRETLVITVLGFSERGLVLTTWTVGGEERVAERALAVADVAALAQVLESAGAWTLTALAVLTIAEGTAELEHEAYEYNPSGDSDPDVLDLDSWAAPRHWKTRRNGADGAGPTRALISRYAPFLPDEFRAASPLAAIFG